MNLKKYNTIILDCDGVVFDSNFLKVKAFKETLENLDFDKKYVNKFIVFMKNNFGISRYKFAEYFIEEILNQKFDVKIYDKIIDLYSKKTFELYLKANYTDDLLRFLKYYKEKNLFIASGSDETELKEIFKIKKIDSHFRGIYGSPRQKSKIVKEITQKFKNSIMIGDAFSDMEASKKAKIDFIFMSDYSTNKALQKMENNIVKINNLGELLE